MNSNRATRLILSLVLSALAAIVGSIPIAFSGGVAWYNNELSKPFFAPPDWLFGPAWTVLFLLMAIAFWLVWQKWPAKEAKMAMGLYLAQLSLNVLWNFVFFGQRSILMGLLEIMVLLAMIALTTYQFYLVDKRAGYLMVPYLLWVSFATCLNAALWLMNP